LISCVALKEIVIVPSIASNYLPFLVGGGDECILGLSFAQQKRHWPQNDIYDCENRITIQDDNTLIISKSSSIDGGAYSCRFVVVGNEIEFSSFIP
jgi:hypothetical protein